MKKKYRMHPIGLAMKWALINCYKCQHNYQNMSLISQYRNNLSQYRNDLYWKKDINNQWHVEINPNQ